jgi:hypothetical protein
MLAWRFKRLVVGFDNAPRLVIYWLETEAKMRPKKPHSLEKIKWQCYRFSLVANQMARKITSINGIGYTQFRAFVLQNTPNFARL